MKWLMYYLIVVNLLTWIIYGIDKWKAKRRGVPVIFVVESIFFVYIFLKL